MEYYNLDLVKSAVLAQAIDNSQTTITIVTGQTFITPPCIGVLATSRGLSDLAAAEHVIITAVNSEDLTVTRGAFGSAKAWASGTYLLGFWSPLHLTQMQGAADSIEYTLSQMFARGANKVIRNSGSTFLKANPNSPADMSVEVAAGVGFVEDKLFRLSSAQQVGPFTAPGSSTRVDLIEANDDGTLSVKTGTEGAGAPSWTSGVLKIAQITLETSTTEITVSEITDSREFA